MEFTTIRYIKRKNINLKNCGISKDARTELDKAKPEDNMILRLLIDDSNMVHIAFAALITTENIRRACGA